MATKAKRAVIISANKELTEERFSLNQLVKLYNNQSTENVKVFKKETGVKTVSIEFISTNWCKVKNNVIADGKLAKVVKVKGQEITKVKTKFSTYEILIVINSTIE